MILIGIRDDYPKRDISYKDKLTILFKQLNPSWYVSHLHNKAGYRVVDEGRTEIGLLSYDTAIKLVDGAPTREYLITFLHGEENAYE